MERAERLSILGEMVPFRFLSPAEREQLAGELEYKSFAAGALVFAAGELRDRALYLLAEGSVEVLQPDSAGAQRLYVIDAGQYFGERAALFDQARTLNVRALEPARCLCLPAERFLDWLARSPLLAGALGESLRERRGIFQAFDRFHAELLHGVSQGEIRLQRLLPHYRAMQPALHPHLEDARRIDFAALSYAVRRLPHNVTRSLVFFLTDDMPELYAPLRAGLKSVPTEARPRTVYEMMPGKSMVLLRDGLSDLFDFVTCLCLFAVEARKLRHRLSQSGELAALSGMVERRRRQAAMLARKDETQVFLAARAFSNEEAQALAQVWPESTLERLHELALQHGDIALEIRKQTESHSTRHSDAWSRQIARATRELVGFDPSSLPPDWRVHVISSNTHSVPNCTSAFLASQREAILDWGRTNSHPLSAEAWHEPADLAYALAREYFEAHPTLAAARARADAENGHLVVHNTAFTGIQVDLLDLRKLVGHKLDPGLPLYSGAQGPELLVNIDFAFGQQAEAIFGALVRLFGRNLASLNVLGKAGALCGARGDVLVPTSFLEQRGDFLQPLPAPALDLARLAARLPAHRVQEGPLLTVVGTLLQNPMMLHFYRRIWNCIGLEMEGWYYYRRALDSQRLGLLRKDLPLRFLYYVSDLPLAPQANLSGRLGAAEGIPPLYAITREILAQILGDQRAGKL